MRTGVVGGVCMAHAPQFFTLPETEDKATVERIQALAAENGRRLKALKPDVTIAIANDHANQFLLHCVPSFTFLRGSVAKGHFAGRDFRWDVAAEVSTALIRHIQDEGFDPAFSSTADLDYSFGIPLTFLGIEGPIVPIYVNAYVPPQPRMERCYALGQAIGRGLKALGVRAVVACSGGLSHFPGTDRYSHPDLAFDRKLVTELATGNLRWLLSLDERRLDETGNIELRCWGVAAGLIGERKPDLVSLDPSWHHNYATLAWWTEPAKDAFVPHYPPVDPARVAISQALYDLANREDVRARFLADPAAYVARLELTDEERRALVRLDDKEINALGVHPFLPFMARFQIERERRERKA
jgi:2,3-dihydroxyphenylpropionate 1,2-dioxygenase